jgi:hypothetical protein
MSCIKLPQWVIDEIERLLRAFFWKGKSTANGSDCMVAWEYVCRDFREGGLGIKNLRIQNDCLLTKFVHRLHVEPNSPWARWVRAAHLNDKDLGDRATNHTRAWLQINGMIDIYRNTTCVQIGDGKCTSLWKDKWTTKGPLCFQFPALFSHAIRPNISVSDCLIDGNWIIPLNHITSSRAAEEKEALLAFLRTCTLQATILDRRGWRSNRSETFSVKNLYNLMNWGGVDYAGACDIWKCAAPKKGKIFAWQMIKGRIKVRAVLFKQNIVVNENCPFGCNVAETAEHFVVDCTRTKQILSLAGIDLNGICDLPDIYGKGKERWPAHKKEAWGLIITAMLWSIWLSRNKKVFDDIEIPAQLVARQGVENCKLWALRARKEEKTALHNWISECPL